MVFGVWWDFGAWGFIWSLARCLGTGLVQAWIWDGRRYWDGYWSRRLFICGRCWSNGVDAHGPRERRRFEIVIRDGACGGLLANEAGPGAQLSRVTPTALCPIGTPEKCRAPAKGRGRGWGRQVRSRQVGCEALGRILTGRLLQAAAGLVAAGGTGTTRRANRCRKRG